MRIFRRCRKMYIFFDNLFNKSSTYFDHERFVSITTINNFTESAYKYLWSIKKLMISFYFCLTRENLWKTRFFAFSKTWLKFWFKESMFECVVKMKVSPANIKHLHEENIRKNHLHTWSMSQNGVLWNSVLIYCEYSELS